MNRARLARWGWAFSANGWLVLTLLFECKAKPTPPAAAQTAEGLEAGLTSGSAPAGSGSDSAAPRASASVSPAPGYHAVTLSNDVRLDVPDTFPRAAKGEDFTFAGPNGATLVVDAGGVCGRSVKQLCADMSSAVSGGDIARAGAPKWTQTIAAAACFETGVRNGKIVWSRTRVIDDAFYGLTFEYPESDRAAYDPIVEHVYASWKPPATSAAYYCSATGLH